MIKNFFNKQPHKDSSRDSAEDDVEALEIKGDGPTIAGVKKNKFLAMAAAAVFSTIIIYYVIFAGSDSSKTKQDQQNLEAVPVPQRPATADKSPFEIEKKPVLEKEDVDIVATPELPSLPSLPEIASTAQEEKSSIIDPPLPPLTAKDNIASGVDNNKPNSNNGNNSNNNNNNPPANFSGNNAPAQENKPINDNVDYKEISPKYAPIIVVSSGGPSPADGFGKERTIIQLKKDGIKALEVSQVSVKTTRVIDRNHSITQGKMLTAVLETAISSEIPGSVRGIVSRDVYGDSGNEVLIPRGSRLYGSYSTKIIRGQGRIDINWSRLIRTDGVDLSISFNAADQFGRSGVQGEVDNRYGNIIATSLLSTTLAAAGAVLAEKAIGGEGVTQIANQQNMQSSGLLGIGQGVGTVTTTKTSNQAIYDITSGITNIAKQVVSNALSVQAVIRVPQGSKVSVIVNADMNLPSLKKSTVQK